MILTFGQIEQLEEARGASPQAAQIGAAIVEAESSGNTEAHGDLSFGQGGGQYVGSLGMWQIFGQAHPQISAGCATDPNCSTDAARQISSNWSDWTPWSTFNSGAYRRYLGTDPGAGGGTAGGGGTQTEGRFSPQSIWDAMLQLGRSVLNPGQNLPPAAGNTLQDLAWRGTLVIFGIVLITVGVVILFRPTSEAVTGAVLPGPGRLQRQVIGA